MRLTKQVAKIEGAAAAAAERLGRRAAAVRIGIVWTSHEVEVDWGKLQPGELVAVDLVLGDCSLDEPGCGLCERACLAKTRERVTRNPRDLGAVYVADGRRVGTMTSIDGSMLTWESWEPGWLSAGAGDE